MCRCRLAKTSLALFLCLCLIAIPLVQRSNALVTTTTVVAILILTVLTAMGITLVIAEGSKEDFILNKGDSFMQSKGYSGSFSDWIKGGSDIEVALKVGFLVLAKDVVDRIKEFVDWLIPNAQSNTTVDLSGNEANTIGGFVVYKGTVNYSRSGNPFVTVTSVGSLYTLDSGGTTTINGTNTSVVFERLEDNTIKCTLTNGYDSLTGNLITGTWTNTSVSSITQGYTLLQVTNWTNRSYLPGIYVTFGVKEWQDSTYNRSIGFLPSNGSPYYSFNVGELTSEEVSSAAIIGDLDDLSDLTNTSVVDDNGTTTIYNTFYVTSGAQALDPSSQDLADIIGALQQALDDINRKLEVIGQTAATAANTTVEPNYSDFDLGNIDLSGLGALLTTRFPFCIPWDFARIFDLFVAEPEAPHWEFDLFENTSLSSYGIDGTLELDLGDYPIVGQVSRWFCIIDFCLALCFITKKLVWVS